jgi:hypothetical protein
LLGFKKSLRFYSNDEQTDKDYQEEEKENRKSGHGPTPKIRVGTNLKVEPLESPSCKSEKGR